MTEVLFEVPEKVGHLLFLFSILFLLVFPKFRPEQKLICFIVLGEQIISSILYIALEDRSIEFFLVIYSLFLFSISLAIREINNKITTRLISLAYIFTAGFHILLLLENIISLPENVAPFLYMSHMIVNLGANFAIIGLILIGGLKLGGRINLFFHDIFASIRHFGHRMARAIHKEKGHHR